MKINTNSQHFAAFSAFLLSSQILFNPLYKSQYKIGAAAVTVIIGLLLNSFFSWFFDKCQLREADNTVLSKSIGIISAVSLCVLSSVLANEFLNAAAMFSNYYSKESTSLLFLAVLLFCCAYAGFSSTGGIMRFCSLSCAGFVIYFAVLFFALRTLGGVVKPDSPDFANISFSFLREGFLSTLYFVCDIPVFFLCCISENRYHHDIIMPKVSRAAFRSSLIILCVNCMRAALMFGNTLSSDLYSCDLTSLTLIPHFSFPEIYLFATGFACILKISVYLYTASVMLPDITAKNGAKSLYKYVLPAIGTFFAVCIIRKLTDARTDFKSPFFAVLCVLCLVSVTLFAYLCFFGKRRENTHG